MRYIVLFEIRTHILKYTKQLHQQGITYEMRSAPRELSKSCVSAVYLNYEGDINEIITSEVYMLFFVDKKGYTLLYSKD
ncbi:MAG: hypothetical protein CVU87_07935 [Firmicutes bacterium HGW-Firmicutes-12]|nr:MAG: hypothetical protein CVU87_07935 [Firmicutes bacterium HGW-Firmicutes-12]